MRPLIIQQTYFVCLIQRCFWAEFLESREIVQNCRIACSATNPTIIPIISSIHRVDHDRICALKRVSEICLYENTTKFDENNNISSYPRRWYPRLATAFLNPDSILFELHWIVGHHTSIKASAPPPPDHHLFHTLKIAQFESRTTQQKEMRHQNALRASPNIIASQYASHAQSQDRSSSRTLSWTLSIHYRGTKNTLSKKKEDTQHAAQHIWNFTTPRPITRRVWASERDRERERGHSQHTAPHILLLCTWWRRGRCLFCVRVRYCDYLTCLFCPSASHIQSQTTDTQPTKRALHSHIIIHYYSICTQTKNVWRHSTHHHATNKTPGRNICCIEHI